MTDSDTPAAGDPELPVITDVAVPGDRARAHGIDLGPSRPPPEIADDNGDAEHYLSERIRAAVAETLPDAIRHAARDGGRGGSGRNDTG